MSHVYVKKIDIYHFFGLSEPQEVIINFRFSIWIKMLCKKKFKKYHFKGGRGGTKVQRGKMNKKV